MEEMKEPRPKISRLEHLPSLPLIYYQNSEKPIKFHGVFDGFSVIVGDEDDMKRLASMGCFGKGNLSRSFPTFRKQLPEIIRNRVYLNRKRVNKHRENNKEIPQKILVLPDSDPEEDATTYFTNLKPRYELDTSGLRESLHLGLEEAFYLAAGLNCLDIHHKDKQLELKDIWRLFKDSDPYFMQKYAVYYHFRTKNWVVKPGIKFGGDFLLYKEGPHFYHASYVVIINIIDEELNRIHKLNWRSANLSDMVGLQRLSETVGKELLICDLIWPQSIDENVFDNFSNLLIKETIMRRWTFKNEEN